MVRQRGSAGLFRAVFLDPEQPSSYLTLLYLVFSGGIIIADHLWTVPRWGVTAPVVGGLLLVSWLLLKEIRGRKQLEISLRQLEEQRQRFEEARRRERAIDDDTEN